MVGVIAPWNYPLTLSVSDAVPALAAGNAVVIKPDSQTPFTALWGFALLEEAGLPQGLVQVVTGSGSELGTPLIDGTDYVMFTGSTATGRKVAEQAGRNLIGASMELGGKNAMIVLEDADLARAAEGAERALFSNAGQLCISIERLFVHEADRRRVHAPADRAGAGDEARHRARLRRRHGLADLGAPSSRRSPRTSTTRSPRARRCSPAAARAPTSARTSTSRRCSSTRATG